VNNTIPTIKPVTVANKRSDAIAKRVTCGDLRTAARVCNHIIYDLDRGVDVREYSVLKDGSAKVKVRAQLVALGINPWLKGEALKDAVAKSKKVLWRAHARRKELFVAAQAAQAARKAA
jgi:hypothetical protein